MQITKDCIINGMPEDVYHNDPTPLTAEGFKEYTSLSSSVALAMVEQTEIEARGKINRFTNQAAEESGEEEDEKEETFSVKLGTMAHDQVLKAGTGKTIYQILPYDAFRKDEAKAARDDLLSRGIIPLANNKKTTKLISSLKMMEERLHEQLAAHEDFPGLMQKGKGEQSGFCFDKKLGIWKRARFDWLDDTYPDVVWDYKTTALPINKWINNELWKDKYIQAPHYQSVHSQITGLKSRFGFIVQMTKKPFLVYVIVIDESCADEVNARYETAQKKFVQCLKTGVWRGAPGCAIHAYPPTWILSNWENDNMIADAVAERDKNAAKAIAAAKEDPDLAAAC